MGTLTERPSLAHPDKQTIHDFFDAIGDQYDFLNSFMSFGLDRSWREKTNRLAISGLERRVLDLGVGTGKSLAHFLKAHSFELAVGCDFSLNMMEKAKSRMGHRANFVAGDFHELPFVDGPLRVTRVGQEITSRYIQATSADYSDSTLALAALFHTPSASL